MSACRYWSCAAALACGAMLVPAIAPGAVRGGGAAATAPPAAAAVHAEAPPLQAEAPRPRVGLVLSGGGARGAAHVGVLKVLEELRVPVDAIAGTSMGAVVGGLYAAGLPAAEIEALLGSVDWQDAFRDRPGRAALNFRRKQDDREFLARLPLGLSAGRLKYPKGLIQGQKLNQKLRAATLPVAHVDDFSRLPIPFRAVATDLETGAPVVLSRGSLATAVRASMAAPGVFAPVEIDGRVLVDGGVAENLPVEALRELGVDVIVAVDVSSPLLPANELGSALAVSQQMVAILISRATTRARATLAARDVVVVPELGTLASTDFSRVRAALVAGEAGARRVAPRLEALALPPERYAAHVARRAERATPARVDFVRVDAESGRYRKLIESALEPALGRPAEGESLDRAIRSLYGRDLFETLDYRVVESEGRSGLEVSARRKSWGPNYVRLGLELQDDFQGGTSYTAGLRFVVTEANPYMAEWNVDLQIGEQPRFAVEFFQPLGYASPWFVAPQFAVGSRSLRTATPDGSPLAEYRVRERRYGLDVGRELGAWGEFRAGVRRVSGSTRLQLGTRAEGTPVAVDFDGGGWFARFAVDRLDSVGFPRHGELFQLQWDAERRSFGADADVDTARADWLLARSRGRHTLIGWASGGSALKTTDGVQRFFPLGGFLNLSGLAADSVAGPHFGIARLVYLNRLGPRGPSLFDVPMYLGLSVEAGNAWERRRDASLGDLRRNVGAFFGLETLLGPLYLGGGYDEGGESAYYLFLGRTF